MPNPITRRAMLTTAAASTAALAATTLPARAKADAHKKAEHKGITLKKGATVLMQGDSITDAGRKRENQDMANDKDMLGKGYASLIAYHLLTAHKDKELKIYNRGISGNKVPDLDKRWQKDCLELKPDVLSIMIGVNDYWHTVAFGSKYDGTVEDYKTGFNALLKRTKESLPDVQLVICEPFVVRDAERTTRADWFPEFSERQAVAKETAAAYDAVWVPFQTMFDDAVAAGTSNKHWSGDAIHVNANGAALMAMRWLSETGLA